MSAPSPSSTSPLLTPGLAHPLRNPRVQLMVVIGLLSVSAFSLWWMYRYVPKTTQISALERHQGQLASWSGRARRDLATIGIGRMQRAIEQIDQQATHVEALVPADTVPAPLLRLLATRASEHGVQIVETAPLTPVREGEFLRDGLAVTAVGRYHELGTLLTSLLSLDRITHLRDVEFVTIRLNADTTTAFRAGMAVTWGVRATFDFMTFAMPTRPWDEPADSTRPRPAARGRRSVLELE